MINHEIPADDTPRLVGYCRNLMTGKTLIMSFAQPVTQTLRGKPWADLIRDHGWTFQTRYLAHVEALLAGAGVELYDLDGAPSPAQSRANHREIHAATRCILDEIEAARTVAATPEADAARRDCRAAFDAAAPRRTA